MVNDENEAQASEAISAKDFPKRRWRNFLVDRQFQLKFSLYFIVSVLAVVGVMVAFIFSRLQDLRIVILQFYGEDSMLQSHLDGLIFEITLVSFLILVGFSAVSFFYSLIITHRIAGPTLVICRFIDDMKEGDFEGNRNLRHHDELRPIMTKLNELAEVLRNRE